MNCHNGEKYLRHSIISIINQTYKNWELIFWDNKSSDDSKKILKSFRDKRIKYYKSLKLLNLYAARNYAINKSKGKFLAFLDTDDWWKKNKLEKQVKKILIDKNIKLIFTNSFIYDQITKKKKIYIKKNLTGSNITQNLLDDYSISLLTVLVSKDEFKKTKFNSKLNIIGDFDYFIKLSLRSEIDYIDETLAYYRVHNNNFSKQKLNLYILELKNWIINNGHLFEEKNYSLTKLKLYLKKLQLKYIIQITKINIDKIIGRVVQW
tara:strand:- start:23 stop:814 length:792 start_codon:yes stop_codon:yes gene_type:complete